MYIAFSTIRDVKWPERGHPTDAGLDFFMPEIDDKFVSGFMNQEANIHGVEVHSYRDEVIIQPGGNACIPSGVKIEIPYGYMGLFLNKSGVASKNDLIIGAQVIDCFYSGEVHIDLHNVGTNEVVITPNMKLAQMVLVPISVPSPTFVDEKDLYVNMRTEEYRGEGGFGSTDSK